MKTLQARVKDGRLIVAHPTKLPEGTILDLVVAEEDDELDEDERAALDAALEKSWESYQGGRTRSIEEVLEKLVPAR